MSSVYVRTQITNFLAAEVPTETVIDLTGHFELLEDVITDAGLDYEDPWLGLQFIGSSEEPVTIGANNQTGKYREFGSIYFHVVAMSKINVQDNILTRSEVLRDTIRGRRINDIVIDGVSPINFESGTTLDFESGYTSGTIIIEYYRDLNL